MQESDMARKQHFMKSHLEIQDWMMCDICECYLVDLECGQWWNPNDRARIRNICDYCYSEWRAKKLKRAEYAKMLFRINDDDSGTIYNSECEK
jgi:hypothetical protein